MKNKQTLEIEKGALRVWWIPQIPGKPFYQHVANLQEASLLLNTLARYDIFQYRNKIKPDFCNVGGLQVYDPADIENGDPETGWAEWFDEETGDEFHTWGQQT